MNKEIGVVVATYNGEKYIKEQLNSIIQQSISPDYIIISDGCSTDNTINVCKEVLTKSGIDYKIFESNKQLSVKENFEKGFRNCNANYIFFSDQDDYWLPEKIKHAIELFEKYDADVVFCNAYITDEHLEGKISLWKKVGYNSSDMVNVYNRYDLKLQSELLKHNIMTGMCMAINSRIKKDILPFSDNGIHDVWIAHASNCLGRVVSLDSKDVYYRQHGNNAIGTTISVKKSFSHRKQYLSNIKKEWNFVNDIVLKYNNKRKASFFNKYIRYSEYLEKRIDYIEKKKNIMYFLKILKKYREFEYKCLRIIIRDIYARITYKKAGDDIESGEISCK